MQLSSWPDERFPCTQLSLVQKEIVANHLRIAGQLSKYQRIRDFLINEFHQKKGIFGLKKYRFTDPEVNNYYFRYLFHRQRQDTNLELQDFQCFLEKVMIHETTFSAEFNYTSVYYDHAKKPENLKLDSFTQSEWELDPTTEMTERDITVMEKYKVEFLAFLEGCLEILNSWAGAYPHWYRIPKSKYTRIKGRMLV